MESIPEKPGFVVTQLTQSLQIRAMELEGAIFSDSIVLNKAMGMTPEYRKQLAILKQNRGIGLSYEHSFCVIDQSNGKIAAVSISEIFNPEHANLPKILMTKDSKPHEKLARFHQELDIKWIEYFKKIGKEPRPDKTISFLVGFTADEYAGQGIFSKLHEICIENLKKMGFEHGFCLVTSDGMKHITLEKFNYDLVEAIHLKDIELDGIRVCESYLEMNPEHMDATVTLVHKIF